MLQKELKEPYITQSSDYDSVEQEVLLNPNDIYVVGAQSGVIDKNGKSNNLYGQTIQQQTYSQKENLENLPARQNRFSRFFNQMRSRFSRGRNDGTQNTTYLDRQQNTKTKTGEKKPWKLEPEEKSRIQRESAEIARKHREQQSQQTQTQQQNQEQGDARMIQGQVPQQPIVDMGGMEL